jgi:alpha-beta hydrolase superfamily lysophospholipase
MPRVTFPTLVFHPTADTEIRIRQAREIHAASGSDDSTYVELAGAGHYLGGHRRATADLILDWLRDRVP